MQMAIRVGVIGASGYTGAELMRLIASHPEFELVLATGDTMAGKRAADLYPALELAYPSLRYSAFEPAAAAGLDLVFLGLPHDGSMELAPQLVGSVGCVVDLSAAYRLKDAALYPTYYGFEHTQPALLADAVFGLPELHRDELKGAQLIATPGCHVTAATLALRPLVEVGAIKTAGIVVDTLTGITGAGRTPTDTNVFTNVDSNVFAYGLVDHRHTPEMEQEIGATLIFTPHIVPMSRGLLATCYAQPTGACSTDDVQDILRAFYDGEPFVASPTHRRRRSPCSGRTPPMCRRATTSRTGTVIAMCAIDNLTKGASGGAVQSANVAVGLDETAGLATIGLAP